MNLLDLVKSEGAGLITAGATAVKQKISAVGSMNAPAATVTGDNQAMVSGVRQPVQAATPAASPTMPGAGGGMSPVAVVGIVLAVLAGGFLVYKAVK